MKTVNLQLAQELRKAGFPQEENSSYFFWVKGLDEWELLDGIHGYYYCAAPTAEEILDLLPEHIVNPKTKIAYTLFIEKEPQIGFYKAYYQSLAWNVHEPDFEDDFQDETIQVNIGLAETLADLWLYLKKENLI